MPYTAVALFTHPLGLLHLGRLLAQAVAEIGDPTGVESSGWEASGKLAARGQVRWHSYVDGGDVHASIQGDVNTNRNADMLDLDAFGPDDGRYWLIVTTTTSNVEEQASAIARLIGALNCTPFVLSDDDHPYPQQAAVVTDVIASGHITSTRHADA